MITALDEAIIRRAAQPAADALAPWCGPHRAAAWLYAMTAALYIMLAARAGAAGEGGQLAIWGSCALLAAGRSVAATWADSRTRPGHLDANHHEPGSALGRICVCWIMVLLVVLAADTGQWLPVAPMIAVTFASYLEACREPIPPPPRAVARAVARAGA